MILLIFEDVRQRLKPFFSLFLKFDIALLDPKIILILYDFWYSFLLVLFLDLKNFGFYDFINIFCFLFPKNIFLYRFFFHLF